VNTEAPGSLRWRCRRGIKELDLMLQAWLEGPYRSATPAERARFAAFLDLPDPEMAACLLARAAPADPDFAPLVAQLARPRP
jgi:antitoxin CptB